MNNIKKNINFDRNYPGWRYANLDPNKYCIYLFHIVMVNVQWEKPQLVLSKVSRQLAYITKYVNSTFYDPLWNED